MGTDVYSIIEVKKDVFLDKHPELSSSVEANQNWVQIPESPWKEERSYLLFSVLANVRNGYGFAGLARHVPLQPITNKRGIPDDCSAKEYIEESWWGNHSHTWILGSEFMHWYNGDIISLVCTGYITKLDFDKWDGNEPDFYVSDVGGFGVVLSDDVNSFTRACSTQLNDNLPLVSITPESTHVRVWWSKSVQTSVSNFYEEVVQPLMNHYGDFRLVMSFD